MVLRFLLSQEPQQTPKRPSLISKQRKRPQQNSKDQWCNLSNTVSPLTAWSVGYWNILLQRNHNRSMDVIAIIHWLALLLIIYHFTIFSLCAKMHLIIILYEFCMLLSGPQLLLPVPWRDEEEAEDGWKTNSIFRETIKKYSQKREKGQAYRGTEDGSWSDPQDVCPSSWQQRRSSGAWLTLLTVRRCAIHRSSQL